VCAAKTAAGRHLAGFSLHPFPASFRPFARRLRGKESSSSSLHPFPLLPAALDEHLFFKSFDSLESEGVLAHHNNIRYVP
jgi:hypothetical protein